MVSTHLADLYGIEPRVLMQAVKRHRDRFPDSCVFQLTADEFGVLKSPFVISRFNKIRRAAPYAFNERAVMELPSILRRDMRAPAVTLAIMRVFVRPYRWRLW